MFRSGILYSWAASLYDVPVRQSLFLGCISMMFQSGIIFIPGLHLFMMFQSGNLYSWAASLYDVPVRYYLYSWAASLYDVPVRQSFFPEMHHSMMFQAKKVLDLKKKGFYIFLHFDGCLNLCITI
ncbi:hypothetical protein CHS0354_030796 [Potamilus streckersoni]|uniref:Uncharacterized protein n=1 Tax=Potamilus streckersoni TaxID=2493646 RepID=A0AAE0WBB9_9BIVA|nr:hypothetical protein CHS0354_030796 [Potamilus streckersoni]